MIRWLTKREAYQFRNEPPYSGINQLHNAIAKEGQDGWEPWHMQGSYTVDFEYITVFYKKREE
jgi:hypothetical protein